jgi:hypothetical protein
MTASRAGARRPVSALGPALVLAAAGVVIASFEYRYGASLGEDSSRFVLASRLLDGRVPYKTLMSPRPPGAYAFDVLSLSAFGRTLGSQHLAASVEGSVIYPLATFLLGRRLVGSPGLALIAGAGVAAAFTPAPGVSLLCALVALSLAGRFLLEGRATALAGAGLATGLELAFSFGVTAATLLAVTLAVAIRATSGRLTPTGAARVVSFRPLVLYLAGAAAGALPFVALVVSEGGGGALARYLADWARRAVTAATVPSTSLRVDVAVLCLPALLTLAARAARGDLLRGRALVVALLASSAIFRLAGASGEPSTPRVALAMADLPLTACAVIAWARESGGRITLRRWDFLAAAACGLASAAAWRAWRTAPAAALVVAVGALASAGVAFGSRRAAPGRTLIRVAALMAALSFAPAAATLGARAEGAFEHNSLLSSAFWPSEEARQIRLTVASALGLSAEGQSVLVYPDGGALAELIGRRDPISFPDLGPEPAAFEVKRALAELARDEPAAVVVRYERAAMGARALTPVTRFLEERYVEARRLDGPELWGIWVRRDQPEICRRLMLYASSARTPPRGESDPAPLAVGRRLAGKLEPVLVQRVSTAAFPMRLPAGSHIRFAPSELSGVPGAERAIELRASGKGVVVWKGKADGVARSIELPPGDVDRADVVLRSPPGVETLWTEPTVCSPHTG